MDEKKRDEIEKSFSALVWDYMKKLLKCGFNIMYKKKKINLILESYHGGGDKDEVVKAIKNWTHLCAKFNDQYSCQSFVSMVATWILDEEGYKEDGNKYSYYI